MKTTISSVVLAAALLAGAAWAGDQPTHDGPRGIMRADTNGDGKVSKDEADALRDKAGGEWFAKVDANGDGYLTQDEIQASRDTRKGKRHDDMRARMDERFKEADANSDGQLSLDEAQAKLPKLAERFNTLDADKNGLLSKDELKRGGPGRPKPQS